MMLDLKKEQKRRTWLPAHTVVAAVATAFGELLKREGFHLTLRGEALSQTQPHALQWVLVPWRPGTDAQRAFELLVDGGMKLWGPAVSEERERGQIGNQGLYGRTASFEWLDWTMEIQAREPVEAQEIPVIEGPTEALEIDFDALREPEEGETIGVVTNVDQDTKGITIEASASTPWERQPRSNYEAGVMREEFRDRLRKTEEREAETSDAVPTSPTLPKLKPSRELDALVALKVMGWKPLSGPADTMDDAFKRSYWKYANARMLLRTPDDYVVPGLEQPVPSFSRDMEEAWTIVKKLERAGFRWGVAFEEVYFERGDPEQPKSYQFGAVMGYDVTRTPFAICLAALRAVGADPRQAIRHTG